MIESVAPAPGEVLSFWRTAGRERWFKRDPAFDDKIRRLFEPLIARAAAGDLAAWEATDEGALALVIVLDQFPRNIYRETSRAFATDAQARAVASRAIARGVDKRIASDLLQFLYMPFMHSEHLADQERCVALFRDARLDDNIPFAEEHADIIRRFGRFPHRNPFLDREATPDEEAFLAQGGFAG